VTDATHSLVPAGWYTDPAGGSRLRWWDGNQWTDHFQEPYSTSAGGLRAPEGTQVYNPWIWLVVFLPYITLPFLFLIDFSSVFEAVDTNDPNAAVQAQLALYTSPAFVAVTVVGLLANALVLWFGYLDWKALKAAGVPKPFHWAFIFFNLGGYPVYPIGRAIVTKRRTGHGSAVLWATIAMIVLAIVVTIGWSVMLVSQVFSSIDPSLLR
jgi:uncharacterized membrane protein